MAATTTEILAAFDRMTIAGLAEFRRAFEARYGVSAAVPVVQQPATPADNKSTTKDEARPEPTEFAVVLTGVAGGGNKLTVIRAVRDLTSLGLAEARDAVTAAPTTIRESVDKDEAEAIRAKLEAAGGAVAVTAA